MALHPFAHSRGEERAAALRASLCILWVVILGALLGASGCAGPPPLPPPPTSTVEASPTAGASPAPGETPTGGPTPSGAAQWTILVYMCGDNELSDAARANFDEMEAAGGSTAAVNVVVQLSLPALGVRRYRVQGDRDFGLIASPVVDDLGPLDMANAATLRDFILWGSSRYPAQRYALIVWDHRLGWGESVIDGMAGNVTSLSGLADALDQAQLAGGPPFFELIGFDASLMAQLEVFAVLAPYGRIAVASEEQMPATGWDYLSTLAALRASPAMDGPAFAKQICEDFISYYVVNNPQDYVTLSAVKLNDIPALAEALSGLIQTLAPALPRHVVTLGDARASVESYGGRAAWARSEQPASVDLWHLAGLLRSFSRDDDVRRSAGALADAAASAVQFNVHDATRPNAGGIAIYFPSDLERVDGRYRQYVPLTVATGWEELLRSYGELLDASPLLTLERADIGPELVTIYAPAFADIELVGPTPESIVLIVGKQLDPSGWLVYRIDRLWPQIVSTEGGVSGMRWSEESGPVSGTLSWDARVPIISAGDVEIAVVSWPTDQSERHQAVYGRYRAQGSEPMESKLIFDDRTGRLERVWAWRTDDENKTPFEILPKEGDRFDPYQLVLDEEGGWTVHTEASLPLGGQPLSLSKQPAGDGVYVAVVRAEDRAGRIVMSDAELQVRNRGLDATLRGYARPAGEFAFLYPADWSDVLFRAPGGLAISDPTGQITLSVTASGRSDGETSVVAALERYLVELRQTGEMAGAPVVRLQRWEGIDIARSRAFFGQAGGEGRTVDEMVFFFFDEKAYLVEVRGPYSNIDRMERVLNIVIESWRFAS